MDRILHDIGLYYLSQNDWKEMEIYALEQGRKFIGYASHYKYVCFGNSEVSFHIVPEKWIGNKGLNYKCHGFDINFRSNTHWRGKVISNEIISGDNREVYVNILPMNAEKAWVLPVRLMHADVLPSIRYGDDLYMQIVCFPDKAVYSEKYSEKLIKNNEIFQPVKNTLLPMSFFPDLDYEDRKKIVLNSEIVAIHDTAPEDKQFWPRDTIANITVKTNFGLLDIVQPLCDLSERQKSFLVPGNIANITGWLSADVAVGEYQGGAILDLEHDLRLLSNCILERKHDRARGIFSADCKYYRNGELRASGVDEIIAALDETGKIVEASDYRMDINYGEILCTNEDTKSEYVNGQKCLVLLTPQNEAYSLMFADTDAHGQICKLYTVYDLSPGSRILRTADFLAWVNGLSSYLDNSEKNTEHENDEVPEARKEEESFFESEEERCRVHGDPSYFDGEPFLAFGDAWDALMPNISDDNGFFLEWRRLIQKAKLSWNFTNIETGAKSKCYDYPSKNEDIHARFISEENPQNNEHLISLIFPVVGGYPALFKVNAAYDCENGICGFVAASTMSGQNFNFFVPSYALTHEQFVPGKILEIDIGGIATFLKKSKKTSFQVNEGPFYEIELAKFLNDNHDKDYRDFEAPVIHFDQEIMKIPQKWTGWYSISAPIRKITEVQFNMNTFYKILLPIIKSEEDNEIFAYVYHAKNKCEPLKKGDHINCEIWFYGDFSKNQVL